MGFEIDFAKVERKLLDYSKRTRGERLRRPLEAGAKVMEKGIKTKLRSIPHKDTGSLMGSIKQVQYVPRGTSSYVRVGIDYNATNSKTGRPVRIYGYVLEHGSKNVAGTHWLSTAREENLEKARNKIIERLKVELDL